MVLVGVQLSVLGLYLPPLFKLPEELSPPHTIISLSAQTAVCPSLPIGAFVVEVATQLSVFGLYPCAGIEIGGRRRRRCRPSRRYRFSFACV